MKAPQESVSFVSDDIERQTETPAPSASLSTPDVRNDFTLRTLRTRAEIEGIQRALGHTGWNRSQAARLLKISYRSLLLKIQSYKITNQTQSRSQTRPNNSQ